jgi:hypothetical protein
MNVNNGRTTNGEEPQQHGRQRRRAGTLVKEHRP